MEDRNDKPTSQPCREFELMMVLAAAGEELDAAEQAELADHLAHCGACKAELEREKDLIAAMASHRAEPDATLLASCRAGLVDALDRREEHGWLRRKIGSLIPANWLAPSPAWSAALLVLIGFSVGVLGPRYFRPPVPPANTAQNDASVTDAGSDQSRTTSKLGSFDLHTADVAGISVMPTGTSEPPQVQLQLRAQQPVTLQGTIYDDDVKRVLLHVLSHNDRYDPDVRLDAVDLLRARNNDPDVRNALCHAVHTDSNTAVRLKALEALNGAEPQDLVRQTLLDALVDDHNPGVRIEAINVLRQLAAEGKVESDDHMRAVLRERMQKDPNTYIRLQSAAAIRDLGPREKF
jgi:hypothetical protein